MNIFLSAANDWNVIDICNKFLFVKLEFIAFISLLQNNRAGIPLNLLIKKKKKTFPQNFFQYTSRNETNRKKQKIYNPSSYSFNPLSIISIHPSSRFPWDMEHMLNIRPNLRLVLHFLKQQCIQRFQFPHQRLPHSIDCTIPSPFYDLPFPRRATANFLVACGCPLLFALNRIVSNRLLILAWTRGRESFKEGSFSMYVCVCVCTRSSGVHIFWYIYSWFRDWFMVVRINCTETIILSVDYFS